MAENIGDSVVGMCTSTDDQILVTADSSGFIKVFDIQDYCMTRSQHMVTEPPRTLHSWKGHEGTVVSVEYINHDAGIFILSASVDKTAKLWTICGDYIGTFGQVNIHTIFLKFTLFLSTSATKDEAKHDLDTTSDHSLEVSQTSQNKDFDFPPFHSSPFADLQQSESIRTSTALPGHPENDQSSVPAKTRQDSVNNGNTKDVIMNNGYMSKETLHAMYVKEKNLTFTCEQNKALRPFLGAKVLCDLQRRRQDRCDRRQQYGDINTKQMARFGKICTPFQVLSMPSII
eukprot:XP_014770200.1 PREDICTED: uncharacterized protein LOC106869138 [Octopus bimaculoides]